MTALVETFPQPGGFFAASLPKDLKRLFRWRLIAAPDAVWSGDSRLGNGHEWPLRGLVVNCVGVFVDPRTGGPISWRHLESRLYGAADRLGAWQLSNGKPRQETLPWGTVRFFDLSHRELQQVFAHELAATSQQHRSRFIFLDEPRAEDTEHLRRILRLYATLTGGKPLPVITNGTFGGEGAPVLVTGRYWQDLPNHYPEIAVRETREDQIALVHTTPAHGCSPEFAACLSAIMGGCYQYTPTNGPFSYDWIPEPFAPGSFGRPTSDRVVTGDLASREFEHAYVSVNLSRDREVELIPVDQPGAILSPLGWHVEWAAKPEEASRG